MEGRDLFADAIEGIPVQPQGRDLFADAPAEVAKQPEGVWETIKDSFTGESNMTDDMRNLGEVGTAPELSEFSMAALKSSLGGLVTGDDKDLEAIFKAQYGDRVSFRKDEKGNSIIKFPSGEYAMNTPGLSSQDIARGALEALTFGKGSMLAQGGKSWLKRAAKQGFAEGLVEATNEGIDTALGGNFDVGDVATSTAFGSGGQVAGEAVGALYRNIKAGLRGNRGAALPDMDTGGKNGKFMTSDTATPDQLITAADNVGIDVPSRDIYQPDTFMSKSLDETSAKFPIIGTAGVNAKRQIARQAAVDDFVTKYTGYSDKAVIDSLKTHRDDVKKKAGDVLSKVEQQVDGAHAARKAAIEKAPGKEYARHVLGDDNLMPTESLSMLGEVRDMLTQPNIIQDAKAIGDVESLISTLNNPQTLSSMRQNRTALREFAESFDAGGKSQMGSNAKRLLRKIEKKMTVDMENTIRDSVAPSVIKNRSGEITRVPGKGGDALVKEWKRANKEYAELAIDMKKTKLKNILDAGDVVPETYQRMLFSGNKSEIKTLYRSLTPDGRDQARKAMVTKLADDAERTAAGLSPDNFASRLKKQRDSFDVFFEGDERKAVDGLFKVLDATRSAQKAALTTPTGQVSYLATLGATTFGSPLAGAALIGTIASNRLYNIPEVRDQLIRLGKLKKSDANFKRVLDDLNSMVQGAAQAIQGSQLEN